MRACFYLLYYILSHQMMKIYNETCKKSTKYDLPNISDNDPLCFSFTQHVSKFSALFDTTDIICSIFFQPGDPISQDQEGQIGNLLAQLDAARQQFLSAWNNTAFTSQFDVFIAEGSNSGYGIYREHLPANVFRPGETMVLYVEPV